VGEVPDRFSVDFQGVRLLGHYLVGAKIAEGGMGAVYRAEDTDLSGKTVVVKVPHPQFLAEPGFRQRFRAEIRDLMDLEHPHVVRILAQGEHDGIPFFVLQHLKGGSLSARLKGAPGARLSPDETAAWLSDVARALDFVHAKGVVHRDVKPGNILFDEHGHVYLSDFGIAKALASTEATITPSGFAPGSPAYMAPEQALGAELSGATDQYALATVVYEALAGRVTHAGNTPLAVLMKKQTEDPSPLATLAPNVPAAASAAVMRALSREPKARFPTCAAFAQAFERGLSSAPPPPAAEPDATRRAPPRAAAPSPPRREEEGAWPPRPARESPWSPATPDRRKANLRKVGLLLVGLAVVGAGAYLFFTRDREPGAFPFGPGPAAGAEIRILRPADSEVVRTNRVEVAAALRGLDVSDRVFVNGRAAPLTTVGISESVEVGPQAENVVTVEVRDAQGGLRATASRRVFQISPTSDRGLPHEIEVVHPLAGQVARESPVLVEAKILGLKTGERVFVNGTFVPVAAPPPVVATVKAADPRAGEAGERVVSVTVQDVLGRTLSFASVAYRWDPSAEAPPPAEPGKEPRVEILEPLDGETLRGLVKVEANLVGVDPGDTVFLNGKEIQLRGAMAPRMTVTGSVDPRNDPDAFGRPGTRQVTVEIRDAKGDVRAKTQSTFQWAPNPPAPASEAVSAFLSGWAEPEGDETDPTTGFPKLVRRTKDGGLMALVPGGTFPMGAVPGNLEAADDESPRHTVTLSKAYYVDVMEVSLGQFRKFAEAAHVSVPEMTLDGTTVLTPAYGVTWEEARLFCAWAGGNLPTEAEWERAARGGHDDFVYPWGSADDVKKRNGGGEDDDGFRRLAPTGSYVPNDFGLYDMAGNVWEWCADWYDDKAYASGRNTDPSGPVTGTEKVLRGSAWNSAAEGGPFDHRVSRRLSAAPGERVFSYGFRCSKRLP
jgi:formylglycine-generating enzyme required for sulfatase activity/serine/threonine protein kinase